MKRISKFLLGLLIILGFTTSVNAASYSSSIKASKSGTSYEYVSGLEIYQNKAGSYNLYVLSTDTYYSATTTLRDPETADRGFAYIIANSDVTSNASRNYYIAQVAILWYQDYLTGTDLNVPTTIKNYIINNVNNNTVCFYINKLVNGAKAYREDAEKIVFNTKNITFTRSGDYYNSNLINVTTTGLKSKPSVKLYNAPKSASIINNTVEADGEGGFQIRIPASSVTNVNNTDFEVYITGSATEYDVAMYTDNGYSPVIYGRTYSSSSNNIQASMPVVLTETELMRVRIRVLDSIGNYISGVRVYAYKGDCSNNTCSSSNLVTSFSTKSTYITLNDVFAPGTYTLAINESRYGLPKKTVINVRDTSTVQEFEIFGETSDNDDDYNEKVTKTFYIINSNNTSISLNASNGAILSKFDGSKDKYQVTLSAGSYYIMDDEGLLGRVYFMITNDGTLKVNYRDGYVTASNIDLDRVYDYIDDENNNYYDDDNNYNDDNYYDDNDNYNDDTNNQNTDNNYYTDGNLDVNVDNDVNTNIDVDVSVSGDLVDCPPTSLFSTIKYIIGASILALGGYLVFRNVKKSKNNI